MGLFDRALRPQVPRGVHGVRVMFSTIVHEHEIGREEDEPRERVRSRVIKIVLFPVLTKNGGLETRRERTVLREIVDVALSGWKRSGVVIPGEDDDVLKVAVELGAPSRFRGVVRIAGEPTVAQVADRQGEVRARLVQQPQGRSKASPCPEVTGRRELESRGSAFGRGDGEPCRGREDYRGEDDAPCSPPIPQRTPLPAVLASPDCICAFRATLRTNAHPKAGRFQAPGRATDGIRGKWAFGSSIRPLPFCTDEGWTRFVAERRSRATVRTRT